MEEQEEAVAYQQEVYQQEHMLVINKKEPYNKSKKIEYILPLKWRIYSIFII